jgi:hypothetical protein
LRLELQQRLLAMHVDLDARIGFKDSQPLHAPQSMGAAVPQSSAVRVTMSV